MDTAQHYSRNDALDIVFRVDKLPDEQNRQRIESTMQLATGIEHAYFDRFRPHLLIIGYDPARINSSRILVLVEQQQLNAKLIVGV